MIKPDYNDIFLRGGTLAIIPPPFSTILAKIGWKEKEPTLLTPFIHIFKENNTYKKQSNPDQDDEQNKLSGARGSAKEKPTTELIDEIH